MSEGPDRYDAQQEGEDSLVRGRAPERERGLGIGGQPCGLRSCARLPLDVIHRANPLYAWFALGGGAVGGALCVAGGSVSEPAERADANIRITLDQYGHLLPGAEDEAAACSMPSLAVAHVPALAAASQSSAASPRVGVSAGGPDVRADPLCQAP